MTLHRLAHLAISCTLLFVAAGVAAGILARQWWDART